MRLLSLALLLAAGGAAAATAAPTPRRVMVLLAHPDDEVLMAGTLARLAREGHAVRAVYATSGDAGEDRSGRGLAGAALAELREVETRRSNRALGFAAPPAFLGVPDGEVFEHLGVVATGFLEAAAAFDPDLLMTLGPDGITGHRDHMAVYLAARQARDRLARRPGFLAAVFTEARAALFDAAWGLRGVRPHAVDLVVPVAPGDARRRVEVLRLHATQFPGAMVEGYRTRTLARDLRETFQGDGRLDPPGR